MFICNNETESAKIIKKEASDTAITASEAFYIKIKLLPDNHPIDR